ncbi:MAG: alpha-ketoglutarate-dependent dioxygenase AlkB family protein [Flavobacteriaceae bacterium]
MLELFPEENSIFSPNIPDGQLTYYPSFLALEEANQLYDQLLQSIPWKADKITVFGKTYDQPRLTSLHALQQTPYTYSNLTLHPNPMTGELSQLLQKINAINPHDFNAVLLNLYRDGKDSNGWHADNEKELGKNPVIASISLGEERFFHLKHRVIKDQRIKIKLQHGSLLLMGGAMQHHWLHQIPKSAKTLQPRINLTFRKII